MAACALSAARELDAKVFACPSTGNLANAVAAAGARAGIKTVVFIPSNLEQPKQVNSAIFTENLVAVDGNYDDVNKLASEIAGEEEGWAFVNVNVRPYYAEGSKTLGYEIAEQLGWRLPDQVVIPVASGSQLTKVDKAFQELIKLGLVEDKPYRVFGAQAEGCGPVATAFKAGTDAIRPVKPDTIAKSLAIGNPADGIYVLDIARRTGGAVEGSPTRRSARASCCSPGPRASSPRPPAAPRSRSPRSWSSPASLTRPRRLWSSTPATGSRPSTRCPARSERRPPSRRRTPPSRPPESDREKQRHERECPDPDDPAHLHRRRVRGERHGREPRRGPRRPRREATPASRPGSWTRTASSAAS